MVVPGSVTDQWRNEGIKFLPSCSRISVWTDGQRDPSGLFPATDSVLSGFPVIIMSHSRLAASYATLIGHNRGVSKVGTAIFRIPAAGIIVDEAHEMRNASTRLQQAVSKLCETADFGIIISGTPVPTRLLDILVVGEAMNLADLATPEGKRFTQSVVADLKAAKKWSKDNPAQFSALADPIIRRVRERLGPDMICQRPDDTDRMALPKVSVEIVQVPFAPAEAEFHQTKGESLIQPLGISADVYRYLYEVCPRPRGTPVCEVYLNLMHRDLRRHRDGLESTWRPHWQPWAILMVTRRLTLIRLLLKAP